MSETFTRHDTKGTTLVLGGTGKTGRRIVERLRCRGEDTRVGSRSAAIPFDWDDPMNWSPVLRDVRTVYVSYQPDLAVPNAPEAIGAFTSLAVRRGVRRLVLLSGRGEPECQVCEEIVKRADVDWTIVRSSWFSQNFSESIFRDAVMSGTVALPVGDVREPFIDADDIADVAVAALTDARHAGEVYEVTGPSAITFAEATAQIAEAAGRDVRFRQISLDEYRAEMREHGAPEEAVSLVSYLFSTVLDGRNSATTTGVERALCRPASDFASFAKRAASSGAWTE